GDGGAGRSAWPCFTALPIPVRRPSRGMSDVRHGVDGLRDQPADGSGVGRASPHVLAPKRVHGLGARGEADARLPRRHRPPWADGRGDRDGVD
ncbi:hypothetical protein ABTA54_19450, partial [Acinetobacter baumannii]